MSALINHDLPLLAERMPFSRQLRAYCLEIKFETLQALRTPAFAIPFVLIPAVIYLLFGVVMMTPESLDDELGPGIVIYLFSGFSVVGVMMAGIFGGCIGLSVERESGLLRLKRALPTPPGASLIAKTSMSMIVTALAVGLVVVVALLAGKITLSLGQVLIIWATMVVGTIPFFAIGFFLGAFASASAAPAWGNLVFLPMMWLSGLFIPLPEFLRSWTVIWPAFHINQIALGLAGVEEFSFFPPLMSAGILVGVTLVFGGFAAHRLARKG
jgi:ABC-2 type transport system permease protein